MQRYGVVPDKSTTIAKKGGVLYDRYSKDLRIYFYGFLSDLGCRNMGVEFKYIPYMHLAECVNKRMRIMGIQDENFGIYLSRYATGSQGSDKISNFEFVKAC